MDYTRHNAFPSEECSNNHNPIAMTTVDQTKAAVSAVPEKETPTTKVAPWASASVAKKKGADSANGREPCDAESSMDTPKPSLAAIMAEQEESSRQERMNKEREDQTNRLRNQDDLLLEQVMRMSMAESRDGATNAPQTAAIFPVSQSDVETLVSMGFSESQSRLGLQRSGGDLASAIELITNNPDAVNETNAVVENTYGDRKQPPNPDQSPTVASAD